MYRVYIALYTTSQRVLQLLPLPIEYPIVHPDYNVGATSGSISQVAPHVTLGRESQLKYLA